MAVSWIGQMKSYVGDVYDSDTDEESTTEVNKVVCLNWNIVENAKLHNTIKFDLVTGQTPRAVLRRGQSFFLKVMLRNRFDMDKDHFVLEIKYGICPSIAKGTKVIIPVQEKVVAEDVWFSVLDAKRTADKDAVFQIHIPSTAHVGVWKLEIRSSHKNKSIDSTVKTFKSRTDFYVLFNPWCQADKVYMTEEKRNEYVVNDCGKIYTGAYNKPLARPWCYDHFGDFVLPVALGLMDMCTVAVGACNDPARVVRGLSTVITNSTYGIIAEQKSGSYYDGVAPCKWVGSSGIMERYIKRGFKPVKYGQSWIIAAVFTSVCRALGIPSRPVTNFICAHDTAGSFTTDKFFDEEGMELDGRDDEDGEGVNSIWAFHTWNDVWMSRPDLPEGYDGWQAIDCTLMAEFEGCLPCGPAPLKALRSGTLGMNYNTASFSTKTEGKLVYWERDISNDVGWIRRRHGDFKICPAILTKACDSAEGIADVENLLGEYKDLKQPEGTVINKILTTDQKRILSNCGNKDEVLDVAFKCVQEADEVGGPFKMKVTAENKGEELRTVRIHAIINSSRYTGEKVSEIRVFDENFTVEPGVKQDTILSMEHEEFWYKMVEHSLLEFHMKCSVKETGQTWINLDYKSMTKPKLHIKVPTGVLFFKERNDVKIKFTNPLEVPLTKGHLSIMASGCCRCKLIDIPEEVPPKGEFNYTVRLIPQRRDRIKIVGAFNANELFDIVGELPIHVK